MSSTIPWDAITAGLLASSKVGPTEGRLRDLSRFLNAQDDLTQCQTAAVIVLSLWQVSGRVWSRDLPSLLLVNATGANDPLDALARESTGMRPKDPEDPEGNYRSGPQTREFMRKLAKTSDTLKKQSPAQHAAWLTTYGKFWVQALPNCFGSARAGQYARRHDPVLGVVTDDDGSAVLRIERAVDYDRLLEDITQHPENILAPPGRDKNIAIVHKAVAISGSLNLEQWSADLVEHILNQCLPILFLPHAAQAPLKGSNGHWPFAVREFENMYRARRAQDLEIHRLRRIPGKLDAWTCALEDRLRARLQHLNGGYAYLVQEALRLLQVACLAIVQDFATHETTLHDTSVLAQDFYRLAATGIAMGIEALAWHCRGFDPGCAIMTAQAILAHVRAVGTVSRRDIQRKLQKSNAAQLKEVLAKLEAEGLVRLEGKTVHAVAFADFVRALPTRRGYPALGLLSPELIEQWDKIAG